MATLAFPVDRMRTTAQQVLNDIHNLGDETRHRLNQMAQIEHQLPPEMLQQLDGFLGTVRTALMDALDSSEQLGHLVRQAAEVAAATDAQNAPGFKAE